MSIENWPAMPFADDFRDAGAAAFWHCRSQAAFWHCRSQALEARLRDTAAALQEMLDSAEGWAMRCRASQESSGIMPEQDFRTWHALSHGSRSWTATRALLAQLKTEGLI